MQSYLYVVGCLLIAGQFAHSKPAPILEVIDVNSDLAKALAKDAVRELNEEHPEALYFYQLELVVVANSKCPKQEVKSYDEIEASADDKQFKVEAIITGSLKDSKRSYNFKISSL